MKNAKFLISIVSILFWVYSPTDIFSQATGDNVPGAGKFLGFSGAQDVDFKTDNILRMQLMQTQSNTINGFPAISQDGYLGLSDELNFFNPGGTGPFSMLHINGDNAGSAPQQLGWRPWMKYGMTVTSNRDLMYVGHLDRGTTDQTDAVITWSDNTFGEPGPDNLRFLFSSGDGQATCGNTSEYGLEAGRFSGEGKFGCGDFSPCGADEQPTHQLDVNGQTRLRDVPNEAFDVVLTGVFADPLDPMDGDYVVNYATISEIADAIEAESDCDWEVIENFPGIDDVITGHGDDCYPAGHAGVGITVPQAKLDVYHGPDQVNHKPDGIKSTYIEESPPSVYEELAAIHGTLIRRPGNPTGRGVWGKSYYAKINYGGDFYGEASDQTSVNIGVRGRALGATLAPWDTYGGQFFGYAPGAGQHVYGVYGRASGGNNAYGIYGVAAGAATNNWAGYFAGNTYATGLYMGSDESLKQNIEPLEGAIDIIGQIQPRQYEYQVDVYNQMNLPTGQQQGVVAQELEEVLPNLVKQTTHPAQYDTLGNEITPAVEFKSVNYIGLIPYLIAGMQEQQQQIGALEDVIDSQNQTLGQVLDQLDDLQQQINNCCSADGAKSFGSSEENPKPDLGENILHQNNPNPFRSQTTISYELEQGGKVTLNIFDKNGKPLATLVEAEQQAGEYRYDWDASGLPAGVYNYALYVDGELLVKKAIKLAD